MHSDFKFEVAHLSSIIKIVDKEINHTYDEMKTSQTRIETLQKSSSGYDDEVQVALNLDHGVKTRYHALVKAREKPYFGRIDFKLDNQDSHHAYYIGKVGVLNKRSDTPYIVDWRAPIASLYYGGEIGDVVYPSPDGAVFGTMNLKRQYQIEEANLVNMYDKNIAPVDEFLNLELGKSKDKRLSDIVATIQSEQNSIIRHPSDTCVIVQGVAGSGKTTIVLHRLAYLLYNHQDTIKPEQVLMLMPNPLFLDYISEVLPDLGVQNINQMTFTQLFQSFCPSINIIKDNFISELYEEKTSALSAFSISILKSKTFKLFIDNAILEYEHVVIETIKKVTETLHLPSQDYIHSFSRDYKHLPLNKRLPKIIYKFNHALECNFEQSQASQKSKLKHQLKDLDVDDPKRRQLFNRLEEELDDEKKALDATKKWLAKSLQPYNVLEVLYQILTTYNQTFKVLIKIKEHALHDILLGQYLYLLHAFEGLNIEQKYAHIIVDEAQDFNIFQFEVLKKINRAHVFTIVGDLNQGIKSYRGIDAWSDITMLAPKHKTMYDEILTCYRSTIEIVEMANIQLKNLENPSVIPQPVLRHGNLPTRQYAENFNVMMDGIKKEITRFKALNSIAILAPDNQMAKHIYTDLKKCIPKVNWLDDMTVSYQGGISVLAIYNAKGLEFDGVIMIDKKLSSEREIHIKMRYVAMTRALHELSIIDISH